MKWQKTVPPRPFEIKLENEKEAEIEVEEEGKVEGETGKELELEEMGGANTNETTTTAAKKLRNRIQNESTDNDISDFHDNENISLKKDHEKPISKHMRENVEEKVE